MTSQMALPGWDAPAPDFVPEALPGARAPAQGFTLFYALSPTPAEAQGLAQATAALCAAQPGSTCLPPQRLHISLHALAHFEQRLPQTTVDAALAAAAAVANTCPPMPLVFDRTARFANQRALVLRCTPASEAAVARLRLALGTAARRRGLRPEAASTPHMTLLYGGGTAGEAPTAPLAWTAAQLTLIVSHLGRGHHQWLGQWALTGV